MREIPVKINKDTPQERTIGTLYPSEKLFVKNVVGSRHLFRVLDAWALDSKFFNKTLLPGKYTVKVIDAETNRVYYATAETIKEHGQYYHFKNKGDDKTQIFLPRKHWDTPKKLTEDEELKKLSEQSL